VNEPKRCVYCGSENDLTVDHVPPKLLLARPYPPNLLTVPACMTCNQSFQKDDEYTRTMLSIDVRAAKNPTAQSNLPAVLRSLQRPDARGFAEYLTSTAESSTVLVRTASRWVKHLNWIRRGSTEPGSGSSGRFTLSRWERQFRAIRRSESPAI
jgi:hypothetical protein